MLSTAGYPVKRFLPPQVLPGCLRDEGIRISAHLKKTRMPDQKLQVRFDYKELYYARFHSTMTPREVVMTQNFLKTQFC